MIEARVFIPELGSYREILREANAELKGHYQIHDIIFRNSTTNAPLEEEFLRLRYIPENIWAEKPVILAIKKTKLQALGKLSDIPAKIQFDSVSEAEDYYAKNLQHSYQRDFDFWREGWQYHLPNGDVVDLEIIEKDYPTIELKSETDGGIAELMKQFGIQKNQVIRGPSVMAVRELLIGE